MITIEFAILGLLSMRPMTGYDIKKMMTGSHVLYWSGNNNQVYTSLAKLHQKEWVTQEIELPSSGPSRKLYRISDLGLEELKKTLLAQPEPPQLIHPFLVQLAWADQLDDTEMDALLAKYEEEMRIQASMLQMMAQQNNMAPSGKMRDSYINPALARTPREAVLWNKIQENWIAFYQNELKWIRELRSVLNAAEEEIRK